MINIVSRGIKMVMALPILWAPQGIWLKMGIKGGRLRKVKITITKVTRIKKRDIQNAELVILSVRMSLKKSFIN